MIFFSENIILHLFTEDMRENYDLESLWVLGSEFDDKTAEVDPLDGFLAENDVLGDFEPLNPTSDQPPK